MGVLATFAVVESHGVSCRKGLDGYLATNVHLLDGSEGHWIVIVVLLVEIRVGNHSCHLNTVYFKADIEITAAWQGGDSIKFRKVFQFRKIFGTLFRTLFGRIPIQSK